MKRLKSFCLLSLPCPCSYQLLTQAHNPGSEVAQSYPTLCDPMDCSLPGSSVHGIFQARKLEWVAISFSRGSSQPRYWTQVSCIVGRCFYHLSHQGSPPSWSPYLVFHRQHPSPHQVQMLFSSIFFLCFIFIHALNKYLKSAHNVPNWCRTLGYGSEQNRPKF